MPSTFLSSLLRKNVHAGANEEWPEIINAKIGENKRIKMEALSAPTKEVCLQSLSANDLKSIKKNDAFLYYSIPGVRSAAVLGQEVDPSDLGTCRLSSSKYFSCPSRIQTAQQTKKAHLQKVTRSKRLSFECHPDLLLESIENMSIEELEEYDDDLVDDALMDFLAKVKGSREM